MSAVVIPVAQFAIRLTITAIWALILSKLIRTTWALMRKLINRFRKKTATTKK
jgi:hypothetical protein